MKVLQIINGLGSGGAEKLIVDTVPEFISRGLVIDVLLLKGDKTPFYRDLETNKSCEIFTLGNSFYNPFYIFKIIPYLKKYDLVHVHLFPSLYFVALAKVFSFSDIKLIFTEHSTANRRMHQPKLFVMERFIYKYYNKIVSISDEVKNSLIHKLNIPLERIITIQNGINVKKIQSAISLNRETMGFSTDDKLISIVAGFRLEKDQDTVIKTLKLLPLNYKILLLGDGVRRNELRKLVEELGLEKRVFFLGFRSDVYSIMKMTDISVLSSHWEGFGLAAAEAMACGIPTVASNVAGLAQVVLGGGVLFEKGNVNDLRAKILELENKIYYESIKKQGLKRANEFDISKMIDKLLITYKDLCKR